MRIKPYLLLLFTALFISCNADTSCNKDEQAELKEILNKSYLAWQTSLDYMEEESLSYAASSLKEKYQDYIACINEDPIFIEAIEEITKVYSAKKINQKALDESLNQLKEMEAYFK